MKANALYHLMQLRARKLNENLPVDIKTILNEIQSSITIKRLPGTYRLDWKVHQTDYNLTLNSDPFKFYEKGDNARHNVKRGDNLNYRRHNWDAALELWKDIFKFSNLDPKSIRDDGRLAFGNFQKKDNRQYGLDNIVIALIFSLISVIKYPLIETLQLFIIIVVLLFFAESFSAVQLRKPMHKLEKIIVSLGSILPLYFGVDQTGIIFNLTGLCLLTKAEKNATMGAIYYILAGLCFGIAAYVMIVFTSAIASVLAVLLVIVSLVDCNRVKKLEAVLFLIGIILSASVIYLAVNYDYIPVYTANIVEYSSDIISLVCGIFLLIVIICFSLWWVTGVQYYLLPWLSLLALSLATVFTLYSGDVSELIMLSVFTGFIIFIASRILSSIFNGDQKIKLVKH